MDPIKKIILIAGCVLFSHCKKSKPSFDVNPATPSIIGKWEMVGFYGSSANYRDTTLVSAEFEFFDNKTKIFTTGYSTSGTYFDSIIYDIDKENWTFNDNGTYVVDEVYKTRDSWAGPSETNAYTASGTWEYISNALTNTGFMILGDPSFAAKNLVSNYAHSTTFKIQSMNNDTLTVTGGDTIYNYGISYNSYFKIVFAKH